MSDERDAYLALTQVPGLGPARLQILLEACHTPLGAHSAPFAFLCTLPGMTAACATAIKQTPLVTGRRLAEAIDGLGATILVPDDPAFPTLLRFIPDPPPVLFAFGDLSLLEEMAGNAGAVQRSLREAAAIVYNMMNLDKPIISAINGVAVGAGLAVALMADISIMSTTARITDGHLRLGVAAGDHAAIVWPLLCGMAKAKYYLMTAEFIDGTEAERIGLVSLCAPPEQLMEKAWAVADRLAAGPQHALRLTKRALNNWLRMAGPIFDTSLAYEMLNFLEPDVREGIAALKEKRPPHFPSAR